MGNEKQAIASCIQYYRKAYGQSLLDFSEDSGVGADAIRMLEHGHGNPTLRTLQSLCAYFGISVADLLAYNPNGAIETYYTDINITETEALSAFLLHFRGLHRQSRVTFAAGCGLCKDTIGIFERCNGNPTLALLQKISKYTGYLFCNSYNHVRSKRKHLTADCKVLSTLCNCFPY